MEEADTNEEVEDLEELFLMYKGYLCLVGSRRIPCKTSALSGHAYMLELMRTPSESRFRDVGRMGKEAFVTLVEVLSQNGGLSASKTISSEEKTFIFLSLLTGHSNRDIAERWQHSGSTISKAVHEVADAILAVKHQYIRQPHEGVPVPGKIINSPNYFPYFEGCIGALDGTHVHAVVPPELSFRFRNRKGFISQNVLGVVDFNMMFTFVLAGWEGSAHDGKVLASAIDKGLVVLPGKYYLGDAGYALKEYVLTPYRGVRYHLKEFGRGTQRPRNKEELFNYRHSQLRNVIERTYGVLKKRFPILSRMYSFPIKFQVQITTCAMILHNFIRYTERKEDLFYMNLDDDIERVAEDDRFEANAVNNTNANMMRDNIATAMWNSFSN